MSAEREKKERKVQGSEVHFPEIEPWPGEVDGYALLSEIKATFEAYLALPDGAAEALAMWTVHAHAHDLCEVSPLLVLRSPAMRCGKTTALRLLGRLVPRPLHASNITASAAFRAVEKYRPTLLVDEADSFIGDNEDLRGLLNSGHVRENATVIRTVGQDFEPRAFSTWAPKAIASIGSLAATLEDRSVTIQMRRRAKGEHVERLRLDRVLEFDALRRQIVRFVGDNAEAIRDADPNVPASLDDRASDNWRPLLAVADVAGGAWPRLARDSAVLLSSGREEETGAREQLLGDCAAVWRGTDAETLPSADMVAALVAMPDRPWAEWNRGKPLSANGLARLLKGFEISPKNIRQDGIVARGYLRADFEDATRRYVAVQNGPVAPSVAVENRATATLFPAPVLDCSGVAVVAGEGEVRP